jgi:hypothetical protein
MNSDRLFLLAESDEKYPDRKKNPPRVKDDSAALDARSVREGPCIRDRYSHLPGPPYAMAVCIHITQPVRKMRQLSRPCCREAVWRGDGGPADAIGEAVRGYGLCSVRHVGERGNRERLSLRSTGQSVAGV